jgi:uncharacterized protein (TIGR02145 family)
MKEASTAHWNSPNTEADNASGFTSLGSGYRASSGSFGDWLLSSYFWSSSLSGSNAWLRELHYNSAGVSRYYSALRDGFAIRCAVDFTDDCGVPNGDNSSCLDDCGVLNGDNSSCLDDCGVPNGDNSSCLDDCGVLNGDNSSCLDDCGVPNGDNSTCFISCSDTQQHDGYDYATVQIGGQCWFSENLRSDHYRNGDAIPGNLPDGTWSTTEAGAQAFYGGEEGNLSEYGRLYNWYAVDDARGLCPSGWHVPSDAEWKVMEMHLGMSEADANSTGWRSSGSLDVKLKEAGTEHWNSSSTGANNSSGFTGLGSGYRASSGGFSNLLNDGYFWSSSPFGGNAWDRGLNYYNAGVNRKISGRNLRYGFAVRCAIDFTDDCGVPNGDNSTCFSCGDTQEYDGYDYATVEIGDQCWFSENLRSEHYSGGQPIPGNLDDATWSNTEAGAQAFYGGEEGNLSEYGRLYNWYAVNDARGLCPSGWHVPSDAEYTVLTDFLGGSGVAGGKMKEAGYGHWNSPNTGATNTSGFTALGGGWRGTSGSFTNLLYNVYFWSSSPSGSSAWSRLLFVSLPDVGRSNYNPRYGFAVRCERD